MQLKHHFLLKSLPGRLVIMNDNGWVDLHPYGLSFRPASLLTHITSSCWKPVAGLVKQPRRSGS